MFLAIEMTGSGFSKLEYNVIIDLDGDIDYGIPNAPNRILYVYLPILDSELPDLEFLHAVAKLAADLCRSGKSVLTHCKMGLNRSALLLGVTLAYLGLSGQEALQLLRSKRPGALFNPIFSEYLESLSPLK
ncbi:MAG: dual specificity protein phosphatase family protein [Acidobacteriota bacterium]|nr:dual specificity protein phosphatase family protein [Blastocatellia bacterium]MDW8413456.1 dual specificity protein phosphatase family protein [Acidobacteriota bacterium]